jgi:hypothetical protein
MRQETDASSLPQLLGFSSGESCGWRPAFGFIYYLLFFSICEMSAFSLGMVTRLSCFLSSGINLMLGLPSYCGLVFQRRQSSSHRR